MKLRILLLIDALLTLTIIGSEFLTGISISFMNVDSSMPMLISSDNEIGRICILLTFLFCLVNLIFKIVGMINNRWRTKWISSLLSIIAIVAVTNVYITTNRLQCELKEEMHERIQTQMDGMKSFGVAPTVSSSDELLEMAINESETYGTKLPSLGVGFFTMLFAAIALGLFQFTTRSDVQESSSDCSIIASKEKPITSDIPSDALEEEKYEMATNDKHASNRKWLYVAGGTFALALIVGGIYTLMNKEKANGVFAGKPIVELFPSVESSSEAGMIPDAPAVYQWDVSQGEECSGDVTVVRKADENQMVVMYETNSCDANILRLGIYQNGQYVFYYELLVGNIDYDETKNGISLHADLPESTIYYGYYGKDVAKTVEQEWGTEHSIDWNNVSEAQLAELFQNVLKDGPKASPYILTYNEIKANMGGAAISDYEEEKELTGFSFLVGNAEFGLDLYADVDGNKVPTGISGTAETLDIFHQYDYDGNGEKEALVYEWGGGNAAYPPYIVYYDKESRTFKKAEGFETIFGEQDVEFEMWEGKMSILVKSGLETARYVFNNHEIKKVESKVPDVGPQLATFTCKQLFGGSSEMEQTVSLDLNNDGADEKLIFTSNSSQAFDDGNAMMLEKIIWSTGTETFGCHQVSESFTFLQSMTNGVNDMITNGSQLQKWRGEEYTE